MRAALLTVFAAALLGLLIFVVRDPAGSLADTPPDDIPGPGPAGAQAPRDGGLATPGARMPDPLPKDDALTPEGEVRSTTGPGAMVGPMRSFHGAALIQFKGELIREAAGGTLELDVIGGGAKTRIQGNVAAGEFNVQVPVNARLILQGGELNGHDVYFEKPKGPFDPTDDHYALVGMVVPRFQLTVRDGLTGTPLRTASVHRAADVTSAWLEGGSLAGDEVTVDQPSPITLPFIDTNRPVWLRVSAPDYAGTHVLVDPRDDGDREVRLWPSAELTVRVTGPGRHRLKMLLAARLDPSGQKLHAATLSISDPHIQKGPDSITFPIQGLAGVSHVLVARGFNAKSQVTELGQIEVSLGPRDTKSVEFRLE